MAERDSWLANLIRSGKRSADIKEDYRARYGKELSNSVLYRIVHNVNGTTPERKRRTTPTKSGMQPVETRGSKTIAEVLSELVCIMRRDGIVSLTAEDNGTVTVSRASKMVVDV